MIEEVSLHREHELLWFTIKIGNADQIFLAKKQSHINYSFYIKPDGVFEESIFLLMLLFDVRLFPKEKPSYCI